MFETLICAILPAIISVNGCNLIKPSYTEEDNKTLAVSLVRDFADTEEEIGNLKKYALSLQTIQKDIKELEPLILPAVESEQAIKETPQEAEQPIGGETFLGYGRVTSYCSPSTGYYPAGTNINCMGRCDETANGFKLKQYMKDTIVACDPMRPMGTKFRLDMGRGSYEVTCLDRGPAIQGKTRFDLWNGIGGAACTEAFTQTYDGTAIYLIE